MDQAGGSVTIQYDYTAACYAPGTRIATAHGEAAIETLRIGDVVRTASGALRPIRWIGRRGYAARFARRNRDLWPVTIRAGALADGIPACDLTVSPRHAMGLDGVLVQAEDLVNATTIVQPEPAGDVAYIHLELDTHDLLLAEGAASESFVDDDSRAMFHNAAEFSVLYPDVVPVPARYCAPRVTEGFVLAAIRARLAARAGLRPPAPRVPLRGCVDRFDAERVAGWAQNPEAPEVPVCLDILVDGVVVAQTLANRPRPDLAAAGLGSGRHAFALRLPAMLTPAQLRAAEIRRSADGAALPRMAAGSRAA